MVACAPIVATSVMKDIEVGAHADAKGAPALTFKIAPGTRQEPKRILSAINFFLARTNKQAAHFNRMAVTHAPRPGQASLQVSATASLVDASDGGGSTCSYDDEGSYDCMGGGNGGGGGGGSGGAQESDPSSGSGSNPDEPTGQCEGNCEFPSGNDNGDKDPCVDANGNPICPVVEIHGPRPGTEEEVSLPFCRPINPFTIECGRTPPVIGGEPQELPRGRTPWFPQSMCNLAHIFCSDGQEPEDNDRGDDSELSGKTLDQLIAVCDRINKAEMTLCSANYAMNRNGGEWHTCKQRANNRMFACYSTAQRVTDNGTHIAP